MDNLNFPIALQNLNQIEDQPFSLFGVDLANISWEVVSKVALGALALVASIYVIYKGFKKLFQAKKIEITDQTNDLTIKDKKEEEPASPTGTSTGSPISSPTETSPKKVHFENGMPSQPNTSTSTNDSSSAFAAVANSSGGTGLAEPSKVKAKKDGGKSSASKAEKKEAKKAEDIASPAVEDTTKEDGDPIPRVGSPKVDRNLLSQAAAIAGTIKDKTVSNQVVSGLRQVPHSVFEAGKNLIQNANIQRGAQERQVNSEFLIKDFKILKGREKTISTTEVYSSTFEQTVAETDAKVNLKIDSTVSQRPFAGVAECKGFQVSMGDTNIIKPDSFTTGKYTYAFDCYGLFDGVDGNAASQYFRDYALGHLIRELSQQFAKEEILNVDNKEKLTIALKNCIKELRAKFKEEYPENNSKSSAVIVLDIKNEDVLWVIKIGECRAVLLHAKDGVPTQLTTDRKNEVEAEITPLAREAVQKENSCIVLGTSGLFSQLTDDNLLRIYQHSNNQHSNNKKEDVAKVDPRSLAEAFVFQAVVHGATDNVSAIVIPLMSQPPIESPRAKPQELHSPSPTKQTPVEHVPVKPAPATTAEPAKPAHPAQAQHAEKTPKSPEKSPEPPRKQQEPTPSSTGSELPPAATSAGTSAKPEGLVADASPNLTQGQLQTFLDELVAEDKAEKLTQSKEVPGLAVKIEPTPLPVAAETVAISSEEEAKKEAKTKEKTSSSPIGVFKKGANFVKSKMTTKKDSKEVAKEGGYTSSEDQPFSDAEPNKLLNTKAATSEHEEQIVKRDEAEEAPTTAKAAPASTAPAETSTPTSTTVVDAKPSKKARNEKRLSSRGGEAIVRPDSPTNPVGIDTTQVSPIASPTASRKKDVVPQKAFYDKLIEIPREFTKEGKKFTIHNEGSVEGNVASSGTTNESKISVVQTLITIKGLESIFKCSAHSITSESLVALQNLMQSKFVDADFSKEVVEAVLNEWKKEKISKMLDWPCSFTTMFGFSIMVNCIT